MLDSKNFSNISIPAVSQGTLDGITVGTRKKVSTQSKRTRFNKYKPEFLDEKWKKTTPFEKMVLTLLSEARSLSTPQIQYLFTTASYQPIIAFDGVLAQLIKKYNLKQEDVPFNRIFNCKNKKNVYTRLDALRRKGLIDSLVWRPNNIEIDKDLAPSLSLSHFFLTELGTQVLAKASGIDRNDIGFIPNYKTYSFGSLLHLTETNDFFISTMFSLQDIINNHLEETGIIDVTLWQNENNSIHKFDLNQESIVFKPDGYMAIFSQKIGGFISFYLEHDVGSSTREKIYHKILSYMKFLMKKGTTKIDSTGKNKPMLLLVTSGNSRIKMYQQVIKKVVQKEFPDYLDYFNKHGRVAITTSELINKYSTIGNIWKVIDLETGELLNENRNLFSLGWNKED